MSSTWPLRSSAPLLCLAAVFLLAACGPSPTAQPPPTQTEVAPSPTAGPPTETPTSTPAPTRTPKPTLSPEEPATASEQVAGEWSIRIRETLVDPQTGSPGTLTLGEDGTFVAHYRSSGSPVWTGTYAFTNGLMTIQSDVCLPRLGFPPFTCTATYHVFVAMAGDSPGSLRFVAIEDPYAERMEALSAKALNPAPP